MATMVPFYAYKETKLNLDPATQSSTNFINLPPHGVPTWTSKQAQKRSFTAEFSVAEDEGQFKQKYLASAASIYYRQHHNSPRSFLWRVLEDGKVLSIRPVDISRPTNAVDPNLTLNLTFRETIKSGCIAFADSKDHDVLSAFVLTESKHLYTLTLRPDFFRKAASTEDNVGNWCKSYYSPGLNFKAAHRMVALSSDELLFSTIDGAILMLSRVPGGDGSEWKETPYNEGSFSQNLRNMISFQRSNPIKYGKDSLALPTATSIASPSTNIGGIPYAFTVSLDHKLRVWNLQNGRIAYSGDILNQEPESNEAAKPVIDPSYSQLVKVYGDDEENILCVTYSPLGTGEFKFWNFSPGEVGSQILEVQDLFPNNRLEPRTPTSDLWTLADFSVLLDHSNIDSFTLWILWKNNITFRVQKLQFSSGKIQHVRDAWSNDWEAMAAETLRDGALPSVLAGDHADGTDKWLEFILTPGRFTTATIETGLAIYGRGLGASKNASHKSGSLEERMCSTIASTASLGRTSDGEMDFEQFRAATDAQWRRFYRLLRELDKQRGEALSLAVDPQGQMPWVVLADGLTAIRECSNLERIWHNQQAVSSGTEYIAALLMAAAALRDTFSEQMLHNCNSALLGEIFEEPSLIPLARMRAFYDKCDFANQIGDEEYAQLQINLGGGFKDVTPQIYDALLELMSASQNINKRPELLPNTEFGNKLILKGVQETVELHRNVCLDQLFLLILIECEINHGVEGIGFETADIFCKLIDMLKRLELMNWLTKTQISLPLPRERAGLGSDTAESLTKKPIPSIETVTVFEGVLRHLIGLDSRQNESKSQELTEIIIQICAPESEYETPPSLIQCFLLKSGRPDLAMEFCPFTLSNPFDTYVQGRAYLASNEALAASKLFKKAAFGIAVPDPKKRGDFRSAGFLDETERNLLNAGLPEYYSHIVALYEKDKIYSFVIDFARLALQFIRPGCNFQLSQLRTEMHSRLFNAAIQTSRYDIAHSVLALYTDPALQHSSLRTLVTKMCESSYASQLTSLPFLGLQDTIDEILAQKCQSIVDVNVGVPYHKILYSWRIKHSDFRGAAAISYERLQRLLQSGDADRPLSEDGLETPVTRQYLALINALSCVDPKQAWILSDELPKKATPGVKPVQPKRKLVTLDDIRKSYQEELDRIAAIENNQFAFAGGDEMEVDML